MKIVSLLGSPRKQGNTAAMAARFCGRAEELGAEVKTYRLNDLVYRGCQGCMACKTSLDRCVLEDDLTEVLDSIRDADVLVLASPVYFWDVSSQLKGFLDRTYSYLVPGFHSQPIKSRLAPGKKLVLILAQGNPDENLFSNIYPKFQYFFEMQGFSETHFIRACGVNKPAEVQSHEEVMKSADRIAEELCNGS